MSTSKQNKGILIIITFTLVALALSACKTSVKVTEYAGVKLSQPWVFNKDFQKALYKTNLMLYGNELSGLTLVKKTGETFRVVFMSEVGLKYLDMEFFGRNDSVVVHHLTSFLDKGNVEKMMINNYLLIFMTFTNKASFKDYQDKTTNSMIKEYRYKKHRIYYTYDKHFGQVSTIDNTFGRKNLMVRLSEYDDVAPQKLNFNRPNLNMHLEMVVPQNQQ